MENAQEDGASSAAPLTPDFRHLFEMHFAYVWTSLRRLGVAERDREDVANEVFFRVHQNLDRYDPARPFRPWLFAFVVRAASEYRRSPRHRIELGGDADASVDWRASPDEQAARTEQRAIAQAALQHVDLEKRTVLILHELDECPIPEIAVALGIAEGTAYSRLRAARMQFASAVQKLQLRGKS